MAIEGGSQVSVPGPCERGTCGAPHPGGTGPRRCHRRPGRPERHCSTREAAMTETRAPAAYDGSGPSSPRWWPSRYGADDELGAGNELTAERTLAALRIPTQGRIIELAQLLEPGIPAY